MRRAILPAALLCGLALAAALAFPRPPAGGTAETGTAEAAAKAGASGTTAAAGTAEASGSGGCDRCAARHRRLLENRKDTTAP